MDSCFHGKLFTSGAIYLVVGVLKLLDSTFLSVVSQFYCLVSFLRHKLMGHLAPPCNLFTKVYGGKMFSIMG